MATVTTVTPTVSVREQIAPATDSDTVADVLDLGTVTGWSFLASFAFPEPSLEFTYNNTGPQLDIGAGRVARFDGGQQQILQVDAVSGVSLAADAVNYVYLRDDNTYEVRDADTPPGADALLLGTIDTSDGTVDTAVRGRSPVGVFQQAITGEDSSGTTTEDIGPSRTVLEAEDMADATARFHREYVPDGEVLTLYIIGALDGSGSATTGLSASVVDDGDGTVYYSSESPRETGSPLKQVFGPVNARFELANDTGGSVTNAAARWVYEVSGGVAAVTTAVYAIGGESSNAATASVDKYDGSTWTAIASMNEAREDHAATPDASENIIVAGGYDVNATNGTVATAEKWDGSSWTYINDIPTARYDHAAASDSGAVYMIGGDDGSGAIASVESWDGSSWSSIADMPTARRTHAATSDANGNIYAISGYNGGYISAVETWDGSSWSSIADIPTARVDMGAATDADGNIYVLGGYNGSDLATAEKWDGSSWSSITDMPTARSDLAAAADASGNIYAIGGDNNNGTLATVEMWDGSQWTTIEDLPSATTRLAATGSLPF